MFDVVFIGSGPGGYVGAIRAAQLGLKTAVIEKDKNYGGTCLNVGCIPSKALLESSEVYYSAQHHYSQHGVELPQVKLDLTKMLARKDKIVKDSTNGISFLFKKNKVETFRGTGKIVSANKIEVSGETGTQVLETKNIVIATGSAPTELPFLKFNEKNILSNAGALALTEVPKDFIVVGGGVIGLELGSVWMKLGANVTVIEYADKLAASMDQQTIAVLQKTLTKQGMKFMLSTKVTGHNIKGDKVEVTYESLKDGKLGSIQGDKVLVCTGRKPYTENLGLNEVGIKIDKAGRIEVDQNWQSNIAGIYAIGDVIAGPMLAHKAEEEGVAVAEILAGHHGHVNYNTVPGVIYTHPEVASVGLTEEQCKSQGLNVRIGSFPFLANGRARALGETDGFVKIIADAHSDKILGGHIVGPRASELLGEIVVAMEFGGSSEDLARSFHAHPTLNEVVREAALAVDKRARQI